jgi:subtilisin family serine protease
MLSAPRGLGFILAAILGAMLVPGCRPDGPSGPSESSGPISPAFSSAQAIPDQYIVVFKSSLPEPAAEARALVAQHGGTLRFTYTAAIKGFSAKLSPQAVDALRRNPNVASVEQDQVVNGADVQQVPTLWSLDRIDQRSLPYDNTYAYANAGSGVNVYILDSGIRLTHKQFGGRAVGAFTAFNDGYGTSDCNGHGTHVAGIVGASTYGVAKGVTLYSVRVLDCNCVSSWSAILAGIDWVTQHRVLPAVVNASWAGYASSTVVQAVQNSIKSGVTWVVASGNYSSDVSGWSPANTPEAITVGATEKNDAMSAYSDFGSLIDVFAPGTDIYSTYYLSDTAFARLSGTSMASPTVAGAAALYLAANPSASPAEVSAALSGNATQGVITSLGAGSPNRLLYTGFVGSSSSPLPPPPPPEDTTATPAPTPPPVDQAPTASFAASCRRQPCSFNASGSSDDQGIVSYTWSFGDGSPTLTESSPIVSHGYQVKGTYNVTLTVSDAAGQTATVSKKINIPKL